MLEERGLESYLEERGRRGNTVDASRAMSFFSSATYFSKFHNCNCPLSIAHQAFHCGVLHKQAVNVTYQLTPV